MGKRPRCPICGSPVPDADPQRAPHFPFCSNRCQQIDLGRWLGERYRIVGPLKRTSDGPEEPQEDS